MANVVVAGATGFVGRVLINGLLEQHHKVIALTRGNLPGVCTIHPGAKCPVEWRRCDVHSLKQCERALQGASIAFYLIHSMLPSAKLTQGGFDNIDLLVADNFARAAKKNGIEHIIFLGGFIPEDRELSRHLRSRLEVEQVLASYGVRVTALRTGIVIGAGSSSFNMLIQTVKKFRFIPSPSVTKSLVQPIALKDLVSILVNTMNMPGEGYQHFDIGGDEILSYRELCLRLAKVLGIKRDILPFNFDWLSFIKFAMSKICSTPKELMYPLLESLQHNMIAKDLGHQEKMGIKPLSLDAAIKYGLSEVPEGSRHRCCAPIPNWREILRRKEVRAVHRTVFSNSKSIEWISTKYAYSHPSFLRFLFKGVIDAQNICIYFRWIKIKLIELQYVEAHSFSDRAFFLITGGILARKQKHVDPEKRPRLEFRRVLNGKFCLIALHNYAPTLPWSIYIVTQAKFHQIFMNRFADTIKREILSEA